MMGRKKDYWWDAMKGSLLVATLVQWIVSALEMTNEVAIDIQKDSGKVRMMVDQWLRWLDDLSFPRWGKLMTTLANSE